MLAEQLRKRWRDHASAVPIDIELNFNSGGLALGAGALLAPAGDRNFGSTTSSKIDEGRLVTLLCAAYGRPVDAKAIAHIRRATQRWDEGETALADMHLALARLGRLAEPREAARRLFMADELLAAGAEPEDILRACGLDPSALGAICKFNVDQPRKPAGIAGAGQWTAELDAANGATTAASIAQQMKAPPVPPAVVGPAAGALARLSWPTFGLLRAFGGQIVTKASPFGALFTLGYLWVEGRTRPPQKVEGDVKGAPGLRYAYYPDETALYLTYRGRVLLVQPGRDGMLRDHNGVIVGRGTRTDIKVIDPAAVARELAEKDEPKLCPKPGPDKAGGKREKDLDYEDYVKQFINPGAPTPRRFSVSLLNPVTGRAVHYDDCQRQTGIMIEAKGTGYAAIIAKENWYVFRGVTTDWLEQSLRQVQASKGRPVQWYFAEPLAAAYAKGLFNHTKEGRENIEIFVLPWSEGMK